MSVMKTNDSLPTKLRKLKPKLLGFRDFTDQENIFNSKQDSFGHILFTTATPIEIQSVLVGEQLKDVKAIK